MIFLWFLLPLSWFISTCLSLIIFRCERDHVFVKFAEYQVVDYMLVFIVFILDAMKSMYLDKLTQH